MSAGIAIVVNGGPPQSGAAVVVRGRTLLPLRWLATVSGATIDYDRASGTVTIRRGERRTELVVGRKTYRSGGVTRHSDVAPRIVEGRTYAPLRIVAESLGALVDYDAATRVVSLDVPQLAWSSTTAQTASSFGPPTIFDRRPQSGGHVTSAFPLIGVSIGTHGSALDPSSLRLLLDGRDVTTRADLVGNQYTFTPAAPVYGGVHRVEVRGQTVDGTPFDEQWSFLSDYGYAVTAPDSSPLGAFTVQPYTYGWNSMSFFLNAPPGGNGYVTLSGIPGYYPLAYRGGNTYVADVQLPYGLRVPYARPTAYFTTASGTRFAVPLASTIYVNTVLTGPPVVAPPPVAATPTPVPSGSPSSHQRRLLTIQAPAASSRPSTPPAPAPSSHVLPPRVAPTASPGTIRAIRIEPPPAAAASAAPVRVERTAAPVRRIPERATEPDQR